MVIPSVILESSKRRLCQDFIRAYRRESETLQQLLEEKQIDQETYDTSVVAMNNDVKYLLSLTQALQPLSGAPASPDP